MFNLNVFLSAKGRIGRQTWWIATVVLYVALFILSFLVSVLAGDNKSAISSIFLLIIELVFAAAYIIVSIKRLHDLDKSGWYFLIALIPIIGGLILFIQMGFLKGTIGPNKYDDDPLRPAATNTIAPAPVITVKAPTPSPTPLSVKPAAPPKPPQPKPYVAPTTSKASYQRYYGSGVCDVCNKSIGPGEAYMVPVSVFYSSRKYKEWLAHGPMSFMIQMAGGVEAFITHGRAMDTTSHSAVCPDCIYMFE